MNARAALIWIIAGAAMAGFALAATIGYYLAGIDNWYITITGIAMGVALVGMHWGDVTNAR